MKKPALTKRHLSLLLSAALVLSLFSGVTMVRATAAASGDFSYEVLEDGTCSVTGYNGTAAELSIPAEIDGYLVTQIGDYAFSTCGDLITGVTLPESVTTIGYSAFDGCTGLTAVTIPESVTTIHKWAFFGCTNLSQLNITSYNIAIGEDAFTNTGVGTYYGDGDYLSDGSNPYFMLYYCSNPWSRWDNVYTAHADTKVIGGSAFSDNYTKLNEVILPEGLTFIGEKAFADAGITVNLPGTVTFIGDHAFSDCGIVEFTALPEGLQSIGEGVFNGCYLSEELQTLVIPADITAIGKSAFQGCRDLREVVISEGCTSIGDYAFSSCQQLQKVSVPDSLMTIGSDVFSFCYNLEYNTVGNGQYLGNENTPDLVLMKGDSSGEISENTLVIGAEAFYKNLGLTEITIPKGVQSIDSNAFLGCKNLKTITFKGDAPVIEAWAFGSSKESDDEVVATAYYPAGNPTWTVEVMQDYSGTITWVPYEAEDPMEKPDGIMITGSISTMKNATGLCVELWVQGNNDSPAYTANISGGTYTFENVLSGNYRLVVTMDHGVAREYPVSADSEEIALDAQISPVGDMSGDGKVNVADTSKAYAWARGVAEGIDDYAQLCGDVTGDGKINVADVSKIYAHTRGVSSLW